MMKKKEIAPIAIPLVSSSDYKKRAEELKRMLKEKKN